MQQASGVKYTEIIYKKFNLRVGTYQHLIINNKMKYCQELFSEMIRI
jgi:hypothetical protein